MSASKRFLVHLCRREDWQAAFASGEYRAGSLTSEGFIHCSRPDQILQVANRYYQGLRDLVLLWIDPDQVQPEIRWEAVGEESFPHIYGPLNLSAVVSVVDFTPDEEGVFRQFEVP
jgi:uncharacterized protein (DUF952 family)